MDVLYKVLTVILDKVILVILSGAGVAIGGVLAWLVGKPIADARDKRLKALQAAEQHSNVGGAASDERVEAAKAVLNDAASGLRSISRGHPWLVRQYCRFVPCDLEAAADALIRLHNMTGDRRYDEEHQFVLATIYRHLGAPLKQEQVDAFKGKAERDKRLSEAKF
jgi:hypothetical protein